jgi:HSP20 family protein
VNLNPLRRSEDFGMTRPTDLFEDLVRDLWSPMFAPMIASRGEGLRRFSPRVNLSEKADAYELEVEMPGVRPEDVNVNLIGDTLTIQGEKSQEERREEDTWHVTERSYGAFQRSFTFPAHVDPEKVEATNENGLLKIRVAKTKESQPRRIEVRAGKGGQKQLETSATEVPVGTSGDAPSKSQGKQQGGKRG